MQSKSRLYPLVAATLLVAGSVFAHSVQKQSSPADGEVVNGSPEAITISFQQPVRITTVTLHNARGQAFEVERPNGMQAREQFHGVPEALPPGQYRLQWRGLAPDGHVMSGKLGFTIK